MNQFPDVETTEADDDTEAFLADLADMQAILYPKPHPREPYTNDRRAGRTNPDLVEIIEATDPRHRSNQGQRTVLNRAERRARGRVNGKAISHSPRHVKATTHPLNSLVLAAKRNAEQLAEAKAAHPAHAPATTELTREDIAA